MNFSISAVCDIGLIRKNNEDMILIGDQLIRNDSVEYTLDAAERNFWIAVSDGMGGHNAGEVASNVVLQKMKIAVAETPSNLTADELHSYLDDKIYSIHNGLNAMGNADVNYHGLGATFIGLFIYEQKAFIINVGDSRLYRLRGGLLAQLSNDHSLSNLLNDASIPSNRLANCFGGGAEKIFFDFEETALFTGDLILLCSDGLCGELVFNEIEALLIACTPLSEMVNLANAKGGNDNVSIIRLSVN